MKRVFLFATICVFLFLVGCNQSLEGVNKNENIYKNKYILDKSNQDDIISFYSRIDEEKKVYTITLINKIEDTKLEDFEVEFKFVGNSNLTNKTYIGKITSDDENYTVVIPVSFLYSNFSKPVIVSAKGYLLSNKDFPNYTEVKELDKDEQAKVKQELENLVSFNNENQLTLVIDILIKVNQKTQKIKQEIGIDINNNYLHMIQDGVSGVVIYDEDGQMVLNNYFRLLNNEYLSVVEYMNLDSVTDYNEYEDLSFKMNDTFIYKKRDSKFIIESTFEELLVATNQKELLDDLGTYKDTKISFVITKSLNGFKMTTDLDLDGVILEMTFDYQFGFINKIDKDSAINLGDSTVSKNQKIREQEETYSDQLILPSTAQYYRYQLEEGYYFFNAKTEKDYSLNIYIFNTNTGKRIDTTYPSFYYNLRYSNLHYLPKGDYTIQVYNGGSEYRIYDFSMDNVLTYNTVLDINKPEYTDPVGDLELKFESVVDVILIKFTDYQDRLIKFTFEEDVYRFPEIFEDGYFSTVRYNRLDRKAFTVLIRGEMLLAFQTTVKETKNIKIEVLAETVEEPLNLMQNNDEYIISFGNPSYMIEITEDSKLSLSLNYQNTSLTSQMRFTIKDINGEIEDTVITIKANQIVDIQLPKGNYTISGTSTYYPFKLTLVNIETN